MIELEDPDKPTATSNFNFEITQGNETQISVKSTNKNNNGSKSGRNTPSRYGARIKSKTKEKEVCTFKPQLSQKSLKMAKKLGNSQDRLTRPKKTFNDTRKSVQNLNRNQDSKYLNRSKSPESGINSKSFSNYSENFDPSMNESFKPMINAKSRAIDKNCKSPTGLSRFELLYNNRGMFN